MPSALLEAMACGLPSVASVQSGACRFIEDGKSGFIVDCEDADSAARHLKVLLTSEERRSRMGVAARERILSGATLDRCAAEHRALYIELLEGTP
jgi:glycosyltransferase involved in cell wall biosynthesis